MTKTRSWGPDSRRRPPSRADPRRSKSLLGPSRTTSRRLIWPRQPSGPTPTTGPISPRSARGTASSALPAVPQTLALYLKSLETPAQPRAGAYRAAPPAAVYNGPTGLALPTLRRRLAAIAIRHTTAGHETPTDRPLVRKMLRRYARSRGAAVQKKDPLLIERLPALLLAMPEEGLAAVTRSGALLLGYAGAFRRSELVALDVEDLKFSAAGLYVWIETAKNDPRKKGRELYVPRLRRSDPMRSCARLLRSRCGSTSSA